MKFLKNNLKVIIAFIVGVILAGGIVYAATSAKDVTYTTAQNTEIKNVEDALNDLYNKNSKIIKYKGYECFQWKCQRSKYNYTAFYSSYNNESTNWDFSTSSTLPYSYQYTNVDITYDSNSYYKDTITAKKKCIMFLYNEKTKNTIMRELNIGDSYILDASTYSTEVQYGIIGFFIGID